MKQLSNDIIFRQRHSEEKNVPCGFLLCRNREQYLFCVKIFKETQGLVEYSGAEYLNKKRCVRTWVRIIDLFLQSMMIP